MSLVVNLVVTLIFVGVALYLIGLIPIDAKILTVIRVVVLCAVILWVLENFGVFSGGHLPTVRVR